MSLQDDIVGILPRERSGALSANRFDFQKDWALCYLLVLHLSEDDYLIVFEYHDDVIVLDSSSNPSNVCFYQIKTKRNGNWTTKALVKRKMGKRGPQPSHLGKLWANRLAFPDYTKATYFVSNGRFKIELASPPESIGRDEFPLSEATAEEIAIIEDTLRDELALVGQLNGHESVFFTVTPLSLDDHADHTLGKLTKFLESTQRGSIPPVPMYRTIKSEITRRNDCERKAASFDEFCASKGLNRSQFETMLASAMPSTKIDDLINNLSQQLRNEDAHYKHIHRICQECRKYLLGRMDHTNTVIASADDTIRAEIGRIATDLGGLPSRLVDTIEAAVETLDHPTVNRIRNDYSTDYLRAMIAVACHEHE